MRQLKSFGSIRISIELNERGVKESIVETYLHAGETSWSQTLVEQYKKKYKNKAIEDYSDKAKRIRFLQYRGFSLDSIYRLVK